MIPDLYPLARAKLDGRLGSGRWSNRGEWKLLLHTTEGRGMPEYNKGEFAPHVTYWPLHRTWTQHFKFGRPAGAIKSFDDDQVIQVEMICFSDKRKADEFGGLWVANLADEHLDDVAAFALWVMGHLDIPARWPGVQALTSSQSNAPGFRFDKEAFRAFGGLLGHQHTPPPNDHWDPGAFRWQEFINRLETQQEDEDMLSRSLDAETWGVLFDQRIVEGRSKKVVVDFWTSQDRTDAEHRHATNVIVRVIAGRVDERLRHPDT